MPYRHDIYEVDNERIIINHSRETVLPNGLITIHRLSSTELGFEQRPLRIPEGLFIAQSMDGLAPSPTEHQPDETVECELDSFAILGAERITERARRLGRVVRFNPNVEIIDQNPEIQPEEKEKLRELHIALFRTFGSQNASGGESDTRPEVGGYL